MFGVPAPRAFRLCFLVGLGLEVLLAAGHAAVYDIDAVLLSRGESYRLVKTLEMALHWLLPAAASVAYVALARRTASFPAWAVAGAVLSLGPHVTASAARIGGFWAFALARGHSRHAAHAARSFDVFFLREAAIVGLIGLAVTLALAAGWGERRLAPARVPASRDRLRFFAAASLLAAPLVAVTLFVGIAFFHHLPSVLHAAAHPDNLGVCARHAGEAYLVPLLLVALFLLSGEAGLRWRRLLRCGFVGAGGLWVVWVLAQGAGTHPVTLEDAVRLSTWPPFWYAMLGLVALMGPWYAALAVLFYLPVTVAIGIAARKRWARGLGVGLAATCFLIVANTMAWSMGPWGEGSGAEQRALAQALQGGLPLILFGWAWRFLTREDVRKLFAEDSPSTT